MAPGSTNIGEKSVSSHEIYCIEYVKRGTSMVMHASTSATTVDLGSSRNLCYDVGVLYNLVKFRWKILPEVSGCLHVMMVMMQDNRQGIKNYVVNLLIKLSSNEVTLRSEKLILRKLDEVLVQVDGGGGDDDDDRL